MKKLKHGMLFEEFVETLNEAKTYANWGLDKIFKDTYTSNKQFGIKNDEDVHIFKNVKEDSGKFYVLTIDGYVMDPVEDCHEGSFDAKSVKEAAIKALLDNGSEIEEVNEIINKGEEYGQSDGNCLLWISRKPINAIEILTILRDDDDEEDRKKWGSVSKLNKTGYNIEKLLKDYIEAGYAA